MRCVRPLRLIGLGLLLSLVCSPTHATKRTVVLVADLASSDVKPSEALTISDLLRGELARERKFILVQRGEMDTIAKELEFQMSGCTDQGCAVQLGEMLNAEKVVVGRVAKLFGRLTISTQVVDMAANDIEFAEEVDCSEEYSALKEAITSLAKRLSAHVPVLAEVKLADGDLVVLDGGAREGLAAGQRLQVLRTEVLKDPQGMPVMEERKVIGEVEITYVNSRDSKARRLSGEIRIGDFARIGKTRPAGAGVATDDANRPAPVPTDTATRTVPPTAVTAKVETDGNAPRGPTSIKIGTRMGDITFAHAAHQQRAKGDCAACHHQNAETRACRSCHDAKPGVPSAKNAFHQVCRDCHKKTKGPTRCKECHVK